MQTIDISTKIKKDYPDLIGTMTLAVPGGLDTFEIIQFKPFLNNLFPKHDNFISDDLLADMKEKLSNKYGYDKSCFKSFGNLETIAFDKLKYYQLKVGINGPRHTELNEPVSVIQYKDFLILENGYHRTLKKIIQGEKLIQAYILTIS